MASFDQIIKGLEILRLYSYNEQIGGAEHDVIYAIPPNVTVSEVDRKVLESLGWHWDEEMGWAHFV